VKWNKNVHDMLIYSSTYYFPFINVILFSAWLNNVLDKVIKF
jgi:hypothetical protein